MIVPRPTTTTTTSLLPHQEDYLSQRDQKRVAIVTGAASGMGLGVAQELARGGHSVALFDINGDLAEAAAHQIRLGGGQAIGVRVDVASTAEVRAATDRVREQFGPVGIVVASAGYAPYAAFQDITDELWQRVIEVNLTGTFTVIQAAISDMVEQNWGRIVTVSSSAGWNGSARHGSYSAAKGGVIALTKSLSWEFAPQGITVNSVAPGPIDTPMLRAAQDAGNLPPTDQLVNYVPARRLGTVGDIVAACLYFCSADAGFVSGQVIGVNGGSLV